jgi:hypothetical protein
LQPVAVPDQDARPEAFISSLAAMTARRTAASSRTAS